jgi:quercetin dioxygenase-like cupin family protein/DNA-binding Xre family transcriptional regulator
LRSLSLRDLSQQCGLSVGFLSQIERGVSSFSIPSLRAICAALDVTPADMLVVAEGPGLAFFVDPRPAAISKGDTRSFVSLSDTSIQYRFLSAKFPGRRFEVLLGEMMPGSSLGAHVHDGEEFGYVLAGSLNLSIGDEPHEIGEGDSYHVLGTTLHGCSANERDGARVLWVETAQYARAMALVGTDPTSPPKAALSDPLRPGADGSPHVRRLDKAAMYRFLSGSLPTGTLEVLVAEIPSDYDRREIAYDGEEFAYVLEGRIELCIAEELYALAAGDCYHLPGGTPHGCTTDADRGARLLLVRMAAMAAEEARSTAAEGAASRAGLHERNEGQRGGGENV